MYYKMFDTYRCNRLCKEKWRQKLSWLEPGAKNAKTVGSIPLWAILWRVGLDNPCGWVPSNSEYSVILWYPGLSENIVQNIEDLQERIDFFFPGEYYYSYVINFLMFSLCDTDLSCTYLSRAEQKAVIIISALFPPFLRRKCLQRWN